MKTALRASRRSTVSQRLKRALALGTPYNYAYSGAPESIVVPAGAKSMLVDIYGAQGGPTGASGLVGAKGARLQARMAVTPGETLQLRVGGAGAFDAAGSPGGYNGGGAGSTNPSGGGGGATDIRRGAFALADRVVVAGGGGGYRMGGSDADSGHGGYPTGGTGGAGSATGGFGGTQSAGGAGGTPSGGGEYGQAGSLGQGGNGGTTLSRRGAGGGGGLYGGGGGGSTSFASPGGGGGGSSYTAPSVVDVVHSTGVRAGHGEATITFSPVNVIALVGFHNSGVGWSSSYTANLEAISGKAVGDLAVLCVDTDSQHTVVQTDGSAFTKVGGLDGSGGGGSGKCHGVFVRTLTGDETNPTFSVNGDFNAALFVLRNAAFDQIVRTLQGGSPDPISTSLTLPSAGALLAFMITRSNSDFATAAIPGFVSDGGPATPQWEANIWSFHDLSVPSGATGTLTVSNAAGADADMELISLIST